jgi:hypothetical protein
MNEGTLSGKSTIRLLGISAERPTNEIYLYLSPDIKSNTGFNATLRFWFVISFHLSHVTIVLINNSEEAMFSR